MWVPLHVHSQYSILDALASVEGIAERAAVFGMPAVALTDHGNLFGAVEFSKACQKRKVKPMIGCELYVAPGSRCEKRKERGEKTAYHLTVLAKNKVGYRNLCKLTSIGYLEGFYYNPRVDKELLAAHSEGLICLSGCLSSEVSHVALGGDREELYRTIKWYQDLFGEDYYLELQRHGMSDAALEADGINREPWLLQQYKETVTKQQSVEKALVEASRELGIVLVATNDSHYIDQKEWRAHEVLLNIQSGEPCEIWERDSQGNPKVRIPNPKRRAYPTHSCYFKSPEEMTALFSDLPEAISATLEVAEKCQFTFDFKSKHYPVFLPPSIEKGQVSEEERQREVGRFLHTLCEEGIAVRYTEERLAKIAACYPGRDPLTVVKERLSLELEVIISKGLADYLLIVWDFIHWAKSRSIPVGPGRGSGAGSIVLYLIGVTDIEPLRFHLFFERFINPERLSYPDIDVDICMDRRQEVIDYTLERYGRDCVAQIITFGTMKAKMVIRDVGRVLSVPLAKVNAIAKLVPDDLNITLDGALEKDPDFLRFYQEDEEARRVIDIGKTLEGAIRSAGVHPAGLIVAGQPLTDLVPICTAKDSDIPVTQYSMKPVEQIGMLKIDFLGLKTLTAIDLCVKAIAVNGQKTIDWMNLPLDDGPAFALLNQGRTLGIFQLESGGMSDLARNLHLDRFEEIIAVGALYRPGPMAMIPSFINRKHGLETIEYDHPWVEEILAETYGIMVYQEQVMQIAERLANYSLGEGDVLRRAMGKKDMAEMERQREKFCLGAQENGIDAETASKIFDKMQQFAAYGFNKSHAAAYGYLSYVTAYFKANYPKEWMAALMTCDRADLSKVSKFIRECRTLGIEMLPPDINEAGIDFVATSKGIRFAMSGIKGVGTSVVEAVVEERQKGGLFSGFYPFFRRLDSKKVGKKAIESLVEAGCFDGFGWSRAALKASVPSFFDAAAKERAEQKAGVISLFSLIGESNDQRFDQPPDVPDFSKRETLFKEKELLGFFLTGHPMDEYREILKRLGCFSLSRIDGLEDGALFRTAFIVESVAVRFSTKRQRKFAILVVSDGMVSYELPIWSDLFEEKQPLLRENQLLFSVLQLSRQEGGVRLQCHWLDDLTVANEKMIAACDQAYDRAKFRAKRSYAKKAAPPAASPSPAAVLPQLHVAIDANAVRLSHILQIKAVLTEARGKSPLSLDFQIGGRSLASLEIQSEWGVDVTEALCRKLKELSAVSTVEKR